MRIDVHDAGNHFDNQTRAYAEYRVFSSLATLADIVRDVGVDLARAADPEQTSTAHDTFACRVSVRLRSGRLMDVVTRAQHAYQAIDRAARHIATVVNSPADAAEPCVGASGTSRKERDLGGECDMNMYRILGDHVGTSEARILAEQLVAWHDSMVKHLRVVGPRRGPACADDCPHEEAAVLWSAAQMTFGVRAGNLAFLRAHGRARRTAGVRPIEERAQLPA